MGSIRSWNALPLCIFWMAGNLAYCRAEDKVSALELLKELADGRVRIAECAEAFNKSKPSICSKELVEFLRGLKFDRVEIIVSACLRIDSVPLRLSLLEFLRLAEKGMNPSDQELGHRIQVHIALIEGHFLVPEDENLNLWCKEFFPYFVPTTKAGGVISYQVCIEACICGVGVSEWGAMIEAERMDKFFKVLAAKGVTKEQWNSYELSEKVKFCRSINRSEPEPDDF